MGRDSTLTGRTEIWTHVLWVAGNPLLGTGFESFWLGDRLANVWSIMPGIQEAHNGYLEVYLNLGWIGVTLLAVIGLISTVSLLMWYLEPPARIQSRFHYCNNNMKCIALALHQRGMLEKYGVELIGARGDFLDGRFDRL